MDRHVSHPRPRRCLAIAAAAAFNAVSALAGVWGLASGVLGLDAGLVSRLPWESPAFGAAALCLLVALPNGVLTLLALRGDRRTGPAAIGTGVLLVGWILVELAFIREFSFFHPLYAAIGLLLAWLGVRAIGAATGIAGTVLLGEVWDVLIDLPVFVTSPLYRRWHLRWGATDHEVACVLPGDDLLPDASYLSTRAITVDAPVEQVWPWLVQVGCLRAGFYSDDLLDNLGRPSERSIRSDLQELHLGQLVPMSPSATPATSFRVTSYDAPHRMLWTKPDSTWAWQLTPTDSGGTRLVTRLRASHPWRRPADGVLSLLLLELGDFAMMRRMLRGVRDRAESGAARQSGSPAPSDPSTREGQVP